MRYIYSIILLALLAALSDCARGAIDESTWRKVFDDPQTRKITKRYLDPRAELEKELREELSKRGVLPKDPVRAQRYVRDYAALCAAYYSRIYNGTKVDVNAAKNVLANDDFDEVSKSMAQLLLYVDSGDLSDLKKYLFASKNSVYPNIDFFLKVRDTEVVNVALEIVSDAYKERVENMNELPGENAKLVGMGLEGFAGIMYKQQKGAVLEVARQLFRDYRLFPDMSNSVILYDAGKVAAKLRQDVSEQAAEDFIYAMYQNCDVESLLNIKRASPELAQLVEKVGERYKDNARKMFDKIGLGKNSPVSSADHNNTDETK
jgi:hypothetical protein